MPPNYRRLSETLKRPDPVIPPAVTYPTRFTKPYPSWVRKAPDTIPNLKTVTVDKHGHRIGWQHDPGLWVTRLNRDDDPGQAKSYIDEMVKVEPLLWAGGPLPILASQQRVWERITLRPVEFRMGASYDYPDGLFAWAITVPATAGVPATDTVGFTIKPSADLTLETYLCRYANAWEVLSHRNELEMVTWATLNTWIKPLVFAIHGRHYLDNDEWALDRAMRFCYALWPHIPTVLQYQIERLTDLWMRSHGAFGDLLYPTTWTRGQGPVHKNPLRPRDGPLADQSGDLIGRAGNLEDQGFQSIPNRQTKGAQGLGDVVAVLLEALGLRFGRQQRPKRWVV